MDPKWNRALVLLAALTILQDGAAFTQTQKPLEVRGVVRSATEGTPVEGVRVTLIRRVPAGQDILLNESVFTDAHGTFVLKAPSPGEYSISASIVPRAFGEYGRVPASSSPQKWFTVTGPTAGIVIQLWTVPTVSGSVFDENGEPLPRTFLQAFRVTTLGGRSVLRSSSGANSRPDGTYAMSIVQPGTYLIGAFPPISPGGPARRAIFYPGVAQTSAARLMPLAMGQSERATDFHSRAEEGWVISGITQLPSDVAGPNSLELFDVSSPDLPIDYPVARARIEPLGRFAFPPVPAGSYEIRFVWFPRPSPGATPASSPQTAGCMSMPTRMTDFPEGPTWWVADPITVRDEDLVVRPQVKPGFRLTGRLVFDGPAPKPDLSVPKQLIYVRSADHRFFTGYPACAPRPDGRFTTVQLPAGRYVLGMLQQYEGYQLVSVKVGGRETAGVAFDVAQDIGNIVLTFSSRQTAIAGQIAGASGANKSVVVWPEDSALWTGTGTGLGRVHRIDTDTGSYRVSVLPGTYRITVLEGASPEDWESPAFLRSLTAVSERVVVPEGQTALVNLRPAPVRRQ